MGDEEKNFNAVPVNLPFDSERIVVGLKKFLSPVPQLSSVYFAFEDPKNKYANIFDGYRVIHEAGLCAAAEKSIHLFPDWYAVAETNYEGAPQCWGRSVGEVVANCRYWRTSFAIIYQETGTEIDPKWLREFNCIAHFDWSDYVCLLRGWKVWDVRNSVPRWFLLKIK
jgi:hypothetical protein